MRVTTLFLSLLLLLFSLTPAFVPAEEKELVIPPEAEITEADQANVALLGEQRGAVNLQGGVLSLFPKVLNLEALALNADNSNSDIDSSVFTIIGKTDGMQGNALSMSGGASDLHGSVLDLEKTIADLNGNIVGNLIILHLAADVLFDFDKAVIKPEAETVLAKVALVIRKKAKGPVIIRGFTDSKGAEDYNLDLSRRRAEAAKIWLSGKGNAQVEYKTEGLGETEPVAPNTNSDGSDNPEGRAKNRRVEIIIKTEQ